MFFAWGWKWSASIGLCIVSNLIWLYNDHVIKWERCTVVAGSRWSDFFVLPNKNMHLLHICAIKSANTLIWVWSKKALSVLLLLFCFVCVFCNIIRQTNCLCNFHYPAVWLIILPPRLDLDLFLSCRSWELSHAFCSFGIIYPCLMWRITEITV